MTAPTTLPSALLYVAKTIPRSGITPSGLARRATQQRTFSNTSNDQHHPVWAVWGGSNLTKAIANTPSRSIIVALQPVGPREFSTSAKAQISPTSLRASNRNNDDPQDGEGGENGNGHRREPGDGEGAEGGDGGDSPLVRTPLEAIQKTLQAESALQKPSVPDVYPQVLALPLIKRPIFPGFYKAVMIKNPNVVSAIKELVKRGQPYVGAFLLKDENVDTDTITDIEQVNRVGVFAQITSAFPTPPDGDGEPGLTAVLYPHRRIRMTELLPLNQDQAKVIHEHRPTDHEQMEDGEGGVLAGVVQQDREKISETVEGEGEGTQVISDVIPSPYATSFLRDYAVSLANIENLVDEPFDRKNPVLRAVTSEIVSVFKDIAALNPLMRDQIATFSMQQSARNVFEEPAKLADFAAAVSSGEPSELQEVLDSLNVEDRMQKALLVLKKELLNAQLQSKISKDVESKITKRQREYYLTEQLKGIKKELGIESDGKDKLVEGFKEKAAKLLMPEAVKKVFDEEITKLAHLEPAASEFNVTRNYLDWLTQVPWGVRSPENYNIKHAIKVLDEDHHGLKDVKDRILEFIAVGKLRGTVEGKIICLVGPPGVGKTSVGKSIARALDRQFYRFSVGGLTDVAEIKGHRRTYVGAMPGKVVQALKKVQTENPLILIDEVDKIGRGHQGDPSSALLELLDPEQNSSFLDHYMDVPVDLSKVLFVCTANVLDTIPGPLLDRMEVIHLSGYVADEKIAIATKYLAPTAKAMAGLENVDVNLTQDAIELLIKSYCRESGVRNLKKHIDKIYRKATFKIVHDIGDENLDSQGADSEIIASTPVSHGSVGSITTGNDNIVEKHSENTSDEFTITKEQQEKAESKTIKERKPLNVPDDIHVQITTENLKDYVGPPIYHSDRLYEKTPPGVVMGLAWTSMGGSALYIESVLESTLLPKSQPQLNRTGQLGDVMKESTTIAFTFAKSLMTQQFPHNCFFDHAQVHLHCPQGAVQKDGPSAGITMATAFLSLALDYPIDPNIAMTGEITLTGKVLQIGGLKEKTIAARRSNVTRLLFPRENQSDWDDLPENIKGGIEGIPVDHYSQVFDVVFANLDRQKADSLWENLRKEDNSGAKDTEAK